MRASSRPRNEAAMSRLQQQQQQTSRARRADSPSSSPAYGGGGGGGQPRASSRPRSSQYGAAGPQSPQPHPTNGGGSGGGGMFSNFHKSNTNYRNAGNPNDHGVNTISLSPEGVIDFNKDANRRNNTHTSPSSRTQRPLQQGSANASSGVNNTYRYDDFIHPRYGGALDTSHMSHVSVSGIGGGGRIQYDDEDDKAEAEFEERIRGGLGGGRKGNDHKNHQQQAAEGMPSSPFMSADKLKELLDENDKLRFIEKEFWALLHEREELHAEVRKLKAEGLGGVSTLLQAKSSNGATEGDGGAKEGVSYAKNVEDLIRKHTASPAPSSSEGGAPSLSSVPSPSATATAAALAAAKDHVGRLQLENETLQIALHECMDLMISEDVRNSSTNTVRRDGPVAAFLTFLRMRHERGEVASALEAARHDIGMERIAREGRANGNTHNGNIPSLLNGPSSSSTTNSPHKEQMPTAAGSNSNNASRNALKSISLELSQAHAQVRALQQELDRTDLSRRQALEDCEHMRKQVEKLNEQLQETTAAYRNTQKVLLQQQAAREQSIALGGGGMADQQQQQQGSITATASSLSLARDPSAAGAAVGSGGSGAFVAAAATSSATTSVLSAQLARKNAEIHQARAHMARLQRDREAETFALANETQRIMGEVAARRSQSAPRNEYSPQQQQTQRYYNPRNESMALNATAMILPDEI